MFIQELDHLTHAEGALADVAREEFTRGPIASRRVNIPTDRIPGPVLQNRIRRLTVIQDASAVDDPDQMAEDALINDLADLVTCPVGQEPIFICCANRGLIARARSAIEKTESHNWLSEVTSILDQLLLSTGLGPGALATDRPECWPLQQDTRFAAWPLDLDSIVAPGADHSPLEQMILTATEESQWEKKGLCGDCLAKELCPFYANFKSLKDPSNRHAILKLLRHSEMAMGQRWNFRDLFSLCAELLIGQGEDFDSEGDSTSPCLWVHERVDEFLFHGAHSSQLTVGWELAFHLYSQALFPVWFDPANEEHLDAPAEFELTRAAMNVFAQRNKSQNAQIRIWLPGAFAKRLDPALATPPNSEDLLRKIEDEFAQSVRQGAATFRQELIPLIDRLLELMAEAEDEWIYTVRESRKARATLESLRILSSILVKRFIGVREGQYLNQQELASYESLFTNPEQLWETAQPLRAVLAPTGLFSGSLIRVFGQSPPDATGDVRVTRPLGTVTPREASTSTDALPGHELPWMEINSHRIPLTFDLFAALQAHSMGAQMASFAPHTRAAIDKVKNAIAGVSARDREGMLGGDVSINIGAIGSLFPTIEGTVLFRKSEAYP